MTRTEPTDFLIIGGGLAGLFAALSASSHGTVALVAKSEFQTSNSSWAQGGIAAAMGPDDSPELHLRDTLQAGRGLSDVRAAETLVSQAASCVGALQSFGVEFDSDENGIHLGQEGGHTRRRIVHAGGSATGKSLVSALIKRVLKDPRIRTFDGVTTTKLLLDGSGCVGASGLSGNGSRTTFRAPATILATGGVAGLYARTTNPPTTTGDGVALAYRAGAEVVDLEFIQFHPTALSVPSGKSFLITEALRGEGATLLTLDGKRFMPDYHPMAELGPRDVVASAVYSEMKRAGSDHVWLDLRHLGAELIRHRFPNIYDSCLDEGIDITRELVPVAPAAHYTIGGVRTDLDARTSVEALWACGEVACTGVHGANRLAGNSLLECLVFSRRAIEAAAQSARQPGDLRPAEDEPASPSPSQADLSEISRLLTTEVGLVRDGPGLQRAQQRFDELWSLHKNELPWRNRLLVARLITEAGLLRTESRGVHRRTDFAAEDCSWRRHVVFQKDREPQLTGA